MGRGCIGKVVAMGKVVAVMLPVVAYTAVGAAGSVWYTGGPGFLWQTQV